MIACRVRQILPRYWGRAANDTLYGAALIVPGAEWRALLHLHALWWMPGDS